MQFLACWGRKHLTKYEQMTPHSTVLLVAVWGRIGRMSTRLERLIALWRTGLLPAPRASRAGEVRIRVRTPSTIPTIPAWLLVAVHEDDKHSCFGRPATCSRAMRFFPTKKRLMDNLTTAVSIFGAALKSKLSGKGVAGAPEDQLRAPLEHLIAAIAVIVLFKPGDVVRWVSPRFRRSKPGRIMRSKSATGWLVSLRSRRPAKAPIRASSRTTTTAPNGTS